MLTTYLSESMDLSTETMSKSGYIHSFIHTLFIVRRVGMWKKGRLGNGKGG